MATIARSLVFVCIILTSGCYLYSQEVNRIMEFIKSSSTIKGDLGYKKSVSFYYDTLQSIISQGNESKNSGIKEIRITNDIIEDKLVSYNKQAKRKVLCLIVKHSSQTYFVSFLKIPPKNAFKDLKVTGFFGKNYRYLISISNDSVRILEKDILTSM